jgi:uncharacterized protein (DUF488 family)
VASGKVYTIGFTKTSAERFFGRLLNAKIKTVIDVRLHNTSQLSGFAKATDLAYFLNKIAKIKYTHEVMLAPTDALLKAYRKDRKSWDNYERSFLVLMQERRIQDQIAPEILDGACLLCSEAIPHRCHRRLVVEYLNEKWNGALEVHHL